MPEPGGDCDARDGSDRTTRNGTRVERGENRFSSLVSPGRRVSVGQRRNCALGVKGNTVSVK